MKDIAQHILLCPRNDEESLMILKIAEKINLPTIISDQPHGAVLAREKNLEDRIKETSSDAKNIVIVEIPGVVEEVSLEKAGLKVEIIDHHRYGKLDRMKEQSSLEQFLAYFEITDSNLEKMGFDSLMVGAVAAMDRGFIWELKRLGLSSSDFERALEFYRKLTLELEGEGRLHEEEIAEQAWKNHEEKDGVIIVWSDDDQTSIRDPISFLVAKTFDEARQVLIVQGDRRMYLQDTSHALELLERFGGFTFGGDKCWGILKEDGGLPEIDEVLSIVVE